MDPTHTKEGKLKTNPRLLTGACTCFPDSPYPFEKVLENAAHKKIPHHSKGKTIGLYLGQKIKQ